MHSPCFKIPRKSVSQIDACPLYAFQLSVSRSCCIVNPVLCIYYLHSAVIDLEYN